MGPGPQLAAERERQGLSRVEMAQRLHMSPLQIEALETGAYTRLPKGPFLRGFVRNYAKALGLDPEAVLASLAQEGPAESAPRIVVPSQNIRFDPLHERLSNPYIRAAGLAAVVISLAFAAMYWWLFIRPTPPATHKPAPEAVSPAPPPPKREPAPEAANVPAPVVPAPTTTSPAVTPSTVPAHPPKGEPAPAKAEERKAEAAKPAPAPAVAKGEALLQFRFEGESWVEVRDARDRVVFQKLNPADSDETVTGKLPLRVIVGNAEEVRVRYNGRDFPLAPHTKVAVARFTLE